MRLIITRNILKNQLPDFKKFSRSLASLFICLIIWGINGLAHAQSPQDQFNEGTRQLSEGQFNEALIVFREIEKQNRVSGALFLNMGIAATRIDSLGLAKFYFTKAQQFEEVQLAAMEGLQYIEWELGRRGARLPQLAWTRITTTLLFQLNHGQLVMLGLLLMNIGVIFIAIHWLRAYLSKTNRFIGIALTCLGIFIIFSGFIMQISARNYNQAIQLSRETQVRMQPDVDSEIIQTGYEGFLYIVDEKRSLNTPEWLYVRMSNGARGWVESNHLKKFKNY